MADEDFAAEAKKVRKELLASLKTKDALIKALKVECTAAKFPLHTLKGWPWQLSCDEIVRNMFMALPLSCKQSLMCRA